MLQAKLQELQRSTSQVRQQGRALEASDSKNESDRALISHTKVKRQLAPGTPTTVKRSFLASIIARWASLCFFAGGTMPDQTWQTLYRQALAESDPDTLKRCIEAARRAIRIRLDELEDSRDTRERQQLNDTLYALQTLLTRKRVA